MRYLENYSNYGKYIDSGTDHDIFHIDDDFILKRPIQWEEGRTKEDLSNFKTHMLFMKQYPEIFAKVKLLVPTRASIEKLNTTSALRELAYITRYLKLYLNDDSIDDRFLLNLYNKQYLIDNKKWYYKTSPKKIENALSTSIIPIIKKWYNFNKKIIKIFTGVNIPNMHSKINNFLDCHAKNIGLDKNGNPKLLDF